MITKEILDELLAHSPETGFFTWKVSRGGVRAGTVAGSTHTCGRVLIKIGGQRYSAHRLAFLTMTGRWPEHEIDHINGEPADNRWVNLRPATRMENARNLCKRSNNTSGVPGVCWDAANDKWMAYIKVDRRRLHLGRFVEFEDAVVARRAAEVKYFGEFSATASRAAA